MAEQETVAFLGPTASYTHQAALDSFDESKYTFQPVVNIEDVFSVVQAGTADYGVVPIENSSNGAVIFTLDLFADLKDRYPDILICGEAYVRIEHCLLGYAPSSPKAAALSSAAAALLHDSTTTGSPASSSGVATPTLDAPAPSKPRTKPLADLSGIKKLYSHPQAWGQCKNFLNAHLRGVERQDCSSTSRAAEEAAKDRTGASAAVSSATAAKLHGLDYLAKGINDRDDNTTRFFVLRRRVVSEAEEEGEPGKDGFSAFRPRDWVDGQGDGDEADMEAWKSLVGFTVDHNDPGALADSLAVFKPYKLNLTSINTRPSGVEKWNYIFFVEFRGRRLAGREGAVNAALRDLGGVARNWRWLGSWESQSAT
ncbi:putative prephenate dehydratase protein [Lasiodiplodia theobromae]|uniref:prephenate dehydratase n=2 Tax=Lasiodiplodia TaxID=66739 RepID=A0A5N5DDN4_9PEZI|nr:PDT domain-containing protein [Lasiodiplodia theobromae]KAB2575805.1 P-protein [Lasiodiplodia theobromae]KAF4545231.1 PDT domain-containing protein [Lasiodiplodia theobromae]KAF9631880.1 putative prephenate dehydratase protein [Lasiodiplodia theobromae]KAK0662814.1 P-protein [Lasiodiplodia hormozganensis]